MRRHLSILAAYLTVSAVPSALLAADPSPVGTGQRSSRDLPVGHPDFRPTPECPMGFRGDGTGCYPGATMVDHFDERSNKNILWKVETPSWGNAGLVVVGDKIFTTCEPWMVLCYSAKDGKLLWKQELNPFTAAGLKGRDLENATTMFEVVTATRALAYKMLGKGGENGKAVIPPEIWNQAFKYLRNFKTSAAAWGPSSIPGWDALIASFEDYRKTQMERKQGLKGIEHMPKEHLLGKLPDITKGVPLTHVWHTMVGYTYATPVTDGKHVFVSMGQGQAACFDLDGKLVWQTYCDPRKVNNQGNEGRRIELRANHVPSPLLAGDRLIVQFEKFLAGIDKTTGKVVWTDTQQVGGGYNVGTHRILRLLVNGKEPLLVVVTTGGRVLRVVDGKLLTDLKASMCGSETGGCPVPALGNLVVFEQGGNDGGDWKGIELSASNRDVVEAKELWTQKYGNNRNAPILLPDRFLKVGFRWPSIYNPRTGEMTKPAFRIFLDRLKDVQAGGEAGSTSILVGDRVLLTSGGAEGWFRTTGKPVQVAYAILDKDGRIPPGMRAKGEDWYDVPKVSVLGGVNMPRDPIVEKYLPDWYKSGELSFEYLPAQFSYCHSGPVAQGNRLYIRSASHIYCIGPK